MYAVRKDLLSNACLTKFVESVKQSKHSSRFVISHGWFNGDSRYGQHVCLDFSSVT
jgi:hypothetical protein